jgi:hypothetical protein
LVPTETPSTHSGFPGVYCVSFIFVSEDCFGSSAGVSAEISLSSLVLSVEISSLPDSLFSGNISVSTANK